MKNRLLSRIFIESFINFIKLPEINELEHLSNGLQRLGDLEGSILDIDGTHIEIQAPSRNSRLYFNTKSFYSINMLVVVDYKMRIRFGKSGFGFAHNSFIYRSSGELWEFI